MSNLCFSCDIETNGLCAGIHSMISLGCCTIDLDNGAVDWGFKRNLLPISDLRVDPATMDWWKGFPDAYKRATDDAVLPQFAMQEFERWVKRICSLENIEHPVLAAWKPAFDIAFIRYYLFRFCGGDLFGRSGSGLDIKTVAAIALNQSFSETQVGKVPAFLKGTAGEHNHDALDDAVEQAHILYKARRVLNAKV